MRNIAEIRGEEALELVADLLEPVATILGDNELIKAQKGGASNMELIRLAIKGHKTEVIKVLAIIDEAEDLEAYAETINIFTLPAKVLALLNNKDLMSLFTSQG